MVTPHRLDTFRTDPVLPDRALALFERCREARWRSQVLRGRSRRAVAEAQATVDEVRQLRFVRLLAEDFPSRHRSPV